MRERLQKALNRIETLKSAEAAQKFSRADQTAGRVLGAAKAVGWSAAAVISFFIGRLVLSYAEGWTAYAAILLTAALIIYAIWRAYRGLFHAPRISEVIVDEVIDRVKPVEKTLGAADALRRRFTGGRSR